jgi:hypothetical protein
MSQLFYDICLPKIIKKVSTMAMNKNTVFGYATLIMTIMGFILIGLGLFRYNESAGWGFGATGVGFLANAWVFSSLKGRV